MSGASAQTPAPAPGAAAPQGAPPATQGAPASPAAAQGPARPPEKFKNLKVLPADISREQLTGIMRNFAGSLGTNCGFCHVGDSPQTMDFASDDKEEKRNARVMIKMTQAINHDTLPQLASMSDDAEVTCYTCHRGAKEPPRRLSDILADTAQAKGADAALAQYKSMRAESLESGQYDFRPASLIAAAGRVREAKKLDVAIALLKATTAMVPDSSEAAASLGTALAESGDAAGAEAELNRALKLDPENRMARFALERLKGRQQPR